MEKMLPNNIAFLRRRKTWAQKRLADAAGIPVTTLNRYETGYTPNFEKHRQAIADALGCAPEDLDSPDLEVATVPVAGIIRHKSFIMEVQPEAQERVERMPGMPETTEAIRIKHNQQKPYHGKNDVLYYDSVQPKNERYFIERECVVVLEGKKRGNRLLAWVSKGSKPNLFIVHPHGDALLLDVKISAALPILHVKRA
jgi:transcriptional regulator with XRE-family HTH domain